MYDNCPELPLDPPENPPEPDFWGEQIDWFYQAFKDRSYENEFIRTGS